MKNHEKDHGGQKPKAGPAKDAVVSAAEAALFQLERQAGVLRDRVRDVAVRRHTSAYIYGPGGTGKTFMVRQVLDRLGAPYQYQAGHLTPLGFFDMLQEYPDSTLVLDDVSSLFRDTIGRQLLLAALSAPPSGGEAREVRYRRSNRDEVAYFSGGLVALSNLPLRNDEIGSAIKSRTRPLCWDPSDAQLAALMRDAVKGGWRRCGADLTAEECGGVIDYLFDECRRFGARLDLRLLFDWTLPNFAAQKMGEHEVDWRDHATMGIQERVQRLQHSGPPMARAERLAMERKVVERILASHGTRREQIDAWVEETGKSERAFDRRSADLRLAQ